MFPSTQIHVDVVTLGLIAGTIVPLLVALLTKSSASPSVKAFTNLVLTGVAAVVALLLANNGSAPWQEVAAAFGSAFLAGGSSYTHLWRPAGATGAIQSKTGNVGVG